MVFLLSEYIVKKKSKQPLLSHHHSNSIKFMYASVAIQHRALKGNICQIAQQIEGFL
jgi:hypothetical protein